VAFLALQGLWKRSFMLILTTTDTTLPALDRH
jgi:hypothetical protein